MAKRKRKQLEQIVTPTPEQIAQGGYKRGMVMHVETATGSLAFMSAHDPVERWKRDGRLSTTQTLAIALVRRLWELAGVKQRVTASYGERIPHSSNEWAAVNEIEARKDLHRIQDYIPSHYWDIFEQVVRHGEPAGVAGSRLGFGSRSGSERAHIVVCFVADVIAMKERLT